MGGGEGEGKKGEGKKGEGEKGEGEQKVFSDENSLYAHAVDTGMPGFVIRNQ